VFCRHTHTREKGKGGEFELIYNSHALVRHGIRRLYTNPHEKKERHPEKKETKNQPNNYNNNKKGDLDEEWMMMIINSATQSALYVCKSPFI
jgi:hypothetical protein